MESNWYTSMSIRTAYMPGPRSANVGDVQQRPLARRTSSWPTVDSSSVNIMSTAVITGQTTTWDPMALTSKSVIRNWRSLALACSNIPVGLKRKPQQNCVDEICLYICILCLQMLTWIANRTRFVQSNLYLVIFCGIFVYKPYGAIIL